LSYAIVAVHAERFADAERLLTEMLSSAERRCEPLSLLLAAMAWIECLCRLGRLNEAVPAVERLIELVELFPYGSPLALTYRAWVLLELGQLEQAALCCAQLPIKPHRGRYSLHRTDGMQLHVRAVLAHRQGDAETACSLFAQLEEWADRTGEADPSFVPWAADAVAAYLACNRDTDARHVIDWVAQRAVALPARWPKIVVTTGQAALAERTGDRALADSYFRQALELHDDLPMPLARTTTLTDYGAFLNRGGDNVRARAVLGEAVHIAETCGAGWHAKRARAQ
jgi:tetratricopeptide (TPR) repeat protein